MTMHAWVVFILEQYVLKWLFFLNSIWQWQYAMSHINKLKFQRCLRIWLVSHLHAWSKKARWLKKLVWRLVFSVVSPFPGEARALISPLPSFFPELETLKSLQHSFCSRGTVCVSLWISCELGVLVLGQKDHHWLWCVSRQWPSIKQWQQTPYFSSPVSRGWLVLKQWTEILVWHAALETPEVSQEIPDN